MDFHKKLQELRKKEGMTQEEVAEALYVSRTAVSKWESGRGYPNIDSLKRIATLFSVTVDELLSGDELLDLAEKDSRQKEHHVHTLAYGLLDCGVSMLLFLPFFGQKTNGMIEAVSLLSLTEVAPYLVISYYALVIAMTAWGLMVLTLQNWKHPLWVRSKIGVSLGLHGAGVVLFIMSLQPYAATFLFLFLLIKVLLRTKGQ